jgi:hypothetical protein
MKSPPEQPAGPMDGETEGYLGGIFGEVSPSVPLMPIAILGSVPSQIAVDARPRRSAAGTVSSSPKRAAPRSCDCPRDGPNRTQGRRPSTGGYGQVAVLVWRELDICRLALARPRFPASGSFNFQEKTHLKTGLPMPQPTALHRQLR